MTTTEFIRKGLEASAGMTLKLIDDMKDQPLTFPTPKGGNHPLWVLGHLAWTEGQLLQVMTGRANPLDHWKSLFGPGTEPSAAAARYPSFEAVRKAFEDQRAQTMNLLATLSDADLDRPSKECPPDFTEFLGTYGQCFLLSIMHVPTHRGQVADARRAAGRKPMGM
ncbi:MAG TPA: DinB family protein [Gemmataceae bacterium]|jgi:hypothetical protein|nr:DinB family protein [Gemmataceae bacterium]